MTAATYTAATEVPGYFVQVRCLLCDGKLHHIADGQGGLSTAVIAECRPCDRAYRVAVAIGDVTDEVGRPSADARKSQRKRDRRRYQGVTLAEALATPATRRCELPDCVIDFMPARKDQEYCSPRHKHTANQRAYKARQRDAEAVA